MSKVEVINKITTKNYIHIPNTIIYSDPSREGYYQLYVTGCRFSGDEYLIGGRDNLGGTTRLYISREDSMKWCRVFNPGECLTLDQFVSSHAIAATNAIIVDEGWRKFVRIIDTEMEGEFLLIELMDTRGNVHTKRFMANEAVDRASIVWFDSLTLLATAEDNLRTEIGSPMSTPMDIVAEKAIKIIQEGGTESRRVFIKYNDYISAKHMAAAVPSIRPVLPT